MTGSLVALDLETTGFSPARGHRVIEIAAVRLEKGMITETFHTIIDCGRTIPKAACQIHGITDEMLCGCPAPEVVFKDFRSFAGKAALIAHNAPFDRLFLQHEYGRLGWGFQNRMLCTLQLSRRCLPGLPNHRLETVSRHLFGSLPAGARLHRAFADARLTAKVWLALEDA